MTPPVACTRAQRLAEQWWARLDNLCEELRAYREALGPWLTAQDYEDIVAAGLHLQRLMIRIAQIYSDCALEVLDDEEEAA